MSTASAWIPEDTFGARLALVRQRLRFNMSEAARICGISEPTWRSWENGAKPRSMDDVVQRIADATGCDRDWLMWGTEVRSRWLATVPTPAVVQQQLAFTSAPALASVS